MLAGFHQHRVLRFWLWQEKRCPFCRELFTRETEWNIRHVIEQHAGGTDKLEGLLLPHLICHRQLYAVCLGHII